MHNNQKLMLPAKQKIKLGILKIFFEVQFRDAEDNDNAKYRAWNPSYTRSIRLKKKEKSDHRRFGSK